MKKLLIGIPLIFASPRALSHEVTVECGKFDNGYEFCYENHGPQGNDFILVEGEDGVESIRVICNYNYTQTDKWSSYGPNDQQTVEKMISTWCN